MPIRISIFDSDLRDAGAGICAGLIMAAVTAPMIATLLYGVRALDVNVFLTVPLILFVVSFTASYVPARRAARVNPIVALREG
jgi:putative ABC transport system permease protein